jgi:serine/threonine protein kinase
MCACVCVCVHVFWGFVQQYLETGPHAMELADNWIVDMSQLFLGHKFATGNYSRLYHGIYKDQEVAVKVIRQPEDAEEKAATLDRQFVQEVSCLSCLHHPNIVQVLWWWYSICLFLFLGMTGWTELICITSSFPLQSSAVPSHFCIESCYYHLLLIGFWGCAVCGSLSEAACVLHCHGVCARGFIEVLS